MVRPMMGLPSLRQRATAFIGLTSLLGSVAALFALAVSGAQSPLTGMIKPLPDRLEISLTPDDVTAAGRLDAVLSRMGYHLDAVAGGKEVPPVFLAAIPADLGDMREIDAKKRVFLRVMLPLVLAVNEEIVGERRRLEDIADRIERNKWVDPADRTWVADLAVRYGLDPEIGPGKPIRALLRRVDTIPPSLALAQAIEESGWGTSRFVREANNLYGHITTAANGVVAGDNSTRRLAAFESLKDSVRAYAHNLNTHRAYEPLRRSREALKVRYNMPDGHTLAGALTAYSERGQDYVDTIRALIRNNALMRYDHARLAKPRTRLELARLVATAQ